MPRLGIGIDRPQIRERLDLAPETRLARALRENQAMHEFRSDLRRIAE
jgi:hypothetical protein